MTVEIKLNVTIDGADGIDLTTVVATRDRYDHDLEESVTEDVTLGVEVAKRLTALLTKDDAYDALRRKFLAVRDEEIRAAVKPLVEDALTAAIEQTNTYGERTGKTTTIRELVMTEAKKVMTERGDYGRGQTVAQRIVAEAVGQAFKNELAKEIVAEREKVAAAVRAKASELIAEAVTKGVGR